MDECVHRTKRRLQYCDQETGGRGRRCSQKPGRICAYMDFRSLIFFAFNILIGPRWIACACCQRYTSKGGCLITLVQSLSPDQPRSTQISPDQPMLAIPTSTGWRASSCSMSQTPCSPSTQYTVPQAWTQCDKPDAIYPMHRQHLPAAPRSTPV